jgi:aspartate/methionine/tyrosine aminotransferase
VLPTPHEASLFTNLNINYISCLPAYNQMGAKVAIESPESGPAIAKMVAAFQERRDVVIEALNRIHGITCQKPKGAFYAFPNIGGVCEEIGAVRAYEELPDTVKPRTSPATLFQMFLLFRYKIATMDRRSFGQIGSEGKHFLRISVATSMEDLKTAMVRLAEAARDRSSFAAFIRNANHLF